MLQEFPEFFFIAKLTDAAQKSLIPAADAAGSNANTPQSHQTSQHSCIMICAKNATVSRMSEAVKPAIHPCFDATVSKEFHSTQGAFVLPYDRISTTSHSPK